MNHKACGVLTVRLHQQVTNPLLRALYEPYSFQVIPKIGEVVANDRASYQYLVESIRKFPDQETFAQMIRDAVSCSAHLLLLCASCWYHVKRKYSILEN